MNILEEDGGETLLDGLTRNCRNFKEFIRYGANWKSTKMEWCVEKVKQLLYSDKENRVIIACSSLVALDVFEAAFEKFDIKTSRIDGQMTQDERDRNLGSFQAKLAQR